MLKQINQHIYRSIAGLLLMFIFGGSAFCQVDSSKTEDLNFLATELPKRHVDLFAHSSKPDFESHVQDLRAKLSSLDQNAFQFEVARLIATIGDGHTRMRMDIGSLHFYPFNARWFDDQIAITAAADAEIAGAELVAINDLPINEVLQRLRPFYSVDNDSGFRQQIDFNLNNGDLLAYACDFENKHSATFQFKKDGKSFTKILLALDNAASKKTKWKFASQSFPLYAQKSNLNYWNDWLADSKTLYFKYNRCQDADGFLKLVNGTAGFIQQNQVDRFVVDLRDNSGGNSAIFKTLQAYLLGRKQFRAPGKLFVIVGRGTFSSGLWAAYELKRMGATVVGEPTGGKPNHFGEIKFITLPNSKLEIFYSTKFWKFLEDEDPVSLVPDLPVEYTAADYFAGEDPAMKAILLFQGEK